MDLSVLIHPFEIAFLDPSILTVYLDPLEKKFHRKNKTTTKLDPPLNFFLLFFMAMVIISASVEGFSVSRMRDFFLLLHNFCIEQDQNSSKR